MAGIQGIGGPVFRNNAPDDPAPRTPKSKASPSKQEDRVEFTEIAREAAQSASTNHNKSTPAASSKGPREERIAQAKARIESGTYKDENIVEMVAQRIVGYIPS